MRRYKQSKYTVSQGVGKGAVLFSGTLLLAVLFSSSILFGTKFNVNIVFLLFL